MALAWYEWAVVGLITLGCLCCLVFIYPVAYRQWKATAAEGGAALYEAREQERKAREAMRDLMVWTLCQGITFDLSYTRGLWQWIIEPETEP